MARVLSGKEVTEALNGRIIDLVKKLKNIGTEPRLAVIRCGEEAADLSYERGVLQRAELLGIEVERHLLDGKVSAERLIEEIDELNRDERVHGVLLFRPLPAHLADRQNEICNHLIPAKDVDCMTDLSYASLLTGRGEGFAPCTPEAVIEILNHFNIDCTGKRAVIIGRSLVVGKPLALMLTARNATVTVCHTKTVNLPAITKEAEILVSSAGVLKSVRAENVTEGQIVIDVAINWDPSRREGKGGIAGDVDYEQVEPVVEAITPVPGGVGTVTTSVLMRHVVEAAEKLMQL